MLNCEFLRVVSFLWTQLLLHLSTDVDETWHKARWWWVYVLEVGIFWFVDFCKSYGPLHLRLFDNVFLWTKLLLQFSTDLDETWHKSRWWWVDVQEVSIFWFVDFCKSYGPLHLDFLQVFLVNATPPTFRDGFWRNLAQSKMMMGRCAWSEDVLVRRILQ
jgi:hypothetical protein